MYCAPRITGEKLPLPLLTNSFTSHIITVAPSQTASLSGVTIAKGNFGAIFIDGGTLTVGGCTLSGNSGGAGGIFN
jgi:hypothetical protein